MCKFIKKDVIFVGTNLMCTEGSSSSMQQMNSISSTAISSACVLRSHVSLPHGQRNSSSSDCSTASAHAVTRTTSRQAIQLISMLSTTNILAHQCSYLCNYSPLRSVYLNALACVVHLDIAAFVHGHSLILALVVLYSRFEVLL
jgi:hypothetical protein